MSKQLNNTADGNALLARIVAGKLEECALLRERSVALRKDAEQFAQKTRGFRQALLKKSSLKNHSTNHLAKQSNACAAAIICESKRASPSAGTLVRDSGGDSSPATLATQAEKADATCLSVLTDARWFSAREGDLEKARSACKLPVLRKDFIIDNLQVYESRLLGADCILLIMRLLEDNQAQELELSALELGMDVLVEVHNEHELERVLKHLQADMIGVNSRDLQSLGINLARALKLIAQVPASRIAIAESGMRKPEDLLPFIKARAENCSLAFLIGEAIMRAQDPQQTIKNFCQVANPSSLTQVA